jgi:integrase/recombinase XerD
MSKQKVIKELLEIVKKNNLSPTEYRYVCTAVRRQAKLTIQKRPKKLTDFLNASEIYTLTKYAAEKNNFTGLLVEFLIFTGLRISEASRIMIQDIDFNNNQLKVVEGKGSKDRYVPLTSNLAQKIKLYVNNRQRGYVFSRSDDKRYTIRALQTRVTNVINECNFSKKLSTHSLRHTFACLCLSKGLRIEQIKLFMGHSSIKTTEIYAKLELGSVKNEFLSLMDMR